MSTEPDLRGLEAVALQRGGYFDRGDALTRGLNDQLLQHHLRTGRFELIYPGVYRLRIAPSTPHDQLLHAGVSSNYRGAISHDSARGLYGLSDLLPSMNQLTVPVEVRRA